MQLVYHPRSWLLDVPKDAKPYASIEVCLAHNPTLKAEDVVSSAFVGGPSDFISEAPEADLKEAAVALQESVGDLPPETPAPEAVPAKTAAKSAKKPSKTK